MNPPNPLPHPRALAHLGDAVYEGWVRERSVGHSEKTRDLHAYTTARVNAEIQGQILEILLPRLNEDLQALIKRAQNMPVATGRRSNQSVHRKATAFEALIGYWYLREPETLPERKQLVLQILHEILTAK